MGLTHIEIQVANMSHPEKRKTVTCLVDSGATFTVLPEKLLRELDIKPHSKKRFPLADGSAMERGVGDALFFYKGERGASPVIFGKEGDSHLLGVVTLETLGLILDPIRRELRSMPMVLTNFIPVR